VAQTLTLLMLGTGTTGASIGLALRRAGENFQRIGYDPDPQTLRKAQQLGAVDRIVNNPAGAASEADLVLLNLPGPNSLPTVEAIAGRLKADTVVLSTAGLHGPAMDPVRERLAPNHPCVAAVPFLGPLAALFDAEGEASADRFDGGMLGIVAPQGTPEGAVEICMDLAMVLHATPFFLEAAELDSVTATSEEIPSLLAAAAVESLQVNPGWRDQRRLVGRPFARLASLVGGKAGSELASELIFNRGPLISRLDALAEELGAGCMLDTQLIPRKDRDPTPVKLSLNRDQLRAVFSDPLLAAQFAQPAKCLPQPGEEICATARRTCMISPYGDVFPCLVFPVPAGNLREKSFREIWTGSPLLRDLRTKTVDDLRGARGVGAFRCGALALIEDGDFLGPFRRGDEMAEIAAEATRGLGDGLP